MDFIVIAKTSWKKAALQRCLQLNIPSFLQYEIKDIMKLVLAQLIWLPRVEPCLPVCPNPSLLGTPNGWITQGKTYGYAATVENSLVCCLLLHKTVWCYTLQYKFHELVSKHLMAELREKEEERYAIKTRNNN